MKIAIIGATGYIDSSIRSDTMPTEPLDTMKTSTTEPSQQDDGNGADTLHYINDPLCGWCYAAEPMVKLARVELGGSLRFKLHAGGLFNDNNLSESKRQLIRKADLRITELTGQRFGVAYFEGTLTEPGMTYDSAIPAAGILAAQQQSPDVAPEMLRALQNAHYLAGRNINDPEVVADVAASLGIPREAFAISFAAVQGERVHQHIEATRELMRQIHASGFPSFFLQSGKRRTRIPHEAHYRSPQGFVAAVRAAQRKI